MSATRQLQGHRLRLAEAALAGHRHRPGHLPLAVLPLNHLQQTHRRQPRLVSDGCRDDVPVRLAVVGGALDAEMLAVLVNEVPLVFVHRFEGVRATLLFALLGQLNEVSQFVVHPLTEVGVLLRPLSHEIVVFWR